MRLALQICATLLLLTALPALVWAEDSELTEAETPQSSLAQDQDRPTVDPPPVGASAVSPVALEFDDDPLLDAEFDASFEFGEEQIVSDPFERTNRVLFRFNRGVQRWVLSPITKSYQFGVPGPIRQGLRRALVNINSPAVLVNDLLQFRFKDAGQTLGRFVLNTTVGWGGLFDVGVEAGWEYHTSDFGQTLARMGVVSGPYLVVPILGPNTMRDGFGDIVDIMFQPLTYLMGPAPNLFLGGGRGFTEFEARASAMEALEGSSVDYYAALRSAYIQNRKAEVELPDEREFEGTE